MLGTYAATVCTIVHDEMFFLEAFLAHYRRLGADRFIILDDCSTDGTMAFLTAQPDVMVVGSGIRYFAQVPYPPETLARIRETRAVRLWRDQMLDQFCAGQWAVVVDPDEFLALPTGPAGVLRVARRRRRRGGLGGHGRHVPANGCATSSAGLPRASVSMTPGSSTPKPHLDPRQPRETPPVPRTVYPGSVSRLFATWGVLPQGTLVRRIRRRLSGYRYQGTSPIHKTPVVFWRPGDWFLNCHVTSKPVAPRVVPIMHFKFTADLGRKIEYALSTGGYNQALAQLPALRHADRADARAGRVLRRRGLAALPGPARLHRRRDRPMKPSRNPALTRLLPPL